MAKDKAGKKLQGKKKLSAEWKPVATDESKREEGYALFEKAMDSSDPDECRSLLGRVIELLPGEIDAWVKLARVEPDSERAKEMLRTAIRYGREQLQDELKRNRGMFWGLTHTRPFMRAQFNFACLLRDQGELEDATDVFEELLELNESDNQGVRWELVEVYLRQDRIDKAEELIACFPDDTMPFLAFSSLLVQFRKYGDSDDLRQKLAIQADLNPYIIPKLLDPHSVDPYTPQTFTPGSEEEANLYCQQLMAVWRSTAGATSWLRAASVSLGSETVDTPVQLSVAEIKQEIQRLRARVKKLPQSDESWFADTTNVSDGDGWILHVVDEETEETLYIEPGEGGAFSQDTLLLALFEAMVHSEDGQSRRPTRIVMLDQPKVKPLIKRLERLGIELQTTDARPEAMEAHRRKIEATLGETEMDTEGLASLPVLAHSWVIDWKVLPMLVPGFDGTPVNPWMVLVVDKDSSCVLGQHLTMQGPQSSDLAVAIREASQFEHFPQPALPEAFILRSADNRPLLDAVAEKLEVSVEVGDCSAADEAFSLLLQHMGTEHPLVPSLVEACEGNLDLVEDFYQVAADFFKTKIWLKTPPKTVVKVSCPDLVPGNWFAVVMGQMGKEIGIVFFDNLEAIQVLFDDSSPADPGASAEYLQGLSFSLDEQFNIHPEEVGAAEQFGWPVAAPEAWPSANVMRDSQLEGVAAAQLRFLSIAVQATTDRLIGSIPDGSIKSDSAGKAVTISIELLD